MATESLTFRVGADTKAFLSALAGCVKGLVALGASFAATKKLTDSFSSALDMAGRFNDLSQRTGETAGNLVVLQRAFTNAGSSAEKVGPSINKMQKTIVDAGRGSKEAEEALASLGLRASDLGGKLPAEQMALIAKRIAGISDPTARAAAAMGIFGKSGGELLPLLLSFSEEIGEARKELGSLPEILTKTSAAVDRVGDKLNTAKEKASEFAYGFWSQLIPGATKLAEVTAGIDAAGLGKATADTLVGAFKELPKTYELLRETGALINKTIGNAVFNAMGEAWEYTKELFGNTETWEAIGDMMKNSLLLGLVEVQKGLNDILQPLKLVIKAISPSTAAILDAYSRFFLDADEISSGIAEASVILAHNSQAAAENSNYVKKDFFGAAQSTEKINELMEEIRKSGEAFNANVLGNAENKERPGKPQRQEEPPPTTPLRTFSNSGSGGGGASKPDGPSLSEIGEAAPNQAVGRSAAARLAERRRAEAERLKSLGRDKQANEIMDRAKDAEDRAMGVALTPKDKAEAEKTARDKYMRQFRQEGGRKESFEDLKDQAESDIADRKRRQSRKAGQGGVDGIDKGAVPEGTNPMTAIATDINKILTYLTGPMDKKLPIFIT